jgi:hypothetical protein
MGRKSRYKARRGILRDIPTTVMMGRKYRYFP